MTPPARILLGEADSPLLDAAADLHVRSLVDTLTSSRGAATVAGIYRRLAREGHAIHLAVDGERVVGGLVVLRHGGRRATLFTLVHRPWSWVGVVRRLGLGGMATQLRDLLAVTRLAGRLGPRDYIVALYVDGTARRGGVARLMLDGAIEDSRRRGVGLGVDTLRTNEPARALYLSAGFTELPGTGRSRLFSRPSD